jgi:hypothetical protein
MGSAVISQLLCPLVGYRFRSLRHVSAHVPLPGSYKRGEWGNSLFTSSLFPPPPPLLQSLRSFDLLLSPVRRSLMRVKHEAQKHKMTKGMNAVTSWVPSVFT